MRILVFAGSARKNSLNRKLAEHVANHLRTEGIEATVKHLGDYDIPLYHGDWEAENGVPASVRELKTLMAEQDAIILVSPEYNGSIPGTLKNTLDWISRPDKEYGGSHPFKNKLFQIMSASPGYFGGVRMQRHLQVVLSQLGAIVLGQKVTVPSAAKVFDEEGKLTDEKTASNIENALADLTEMIN